MTTTTIPASSNGTNQMNREQRRKQQRQGRTVVQPTIVEAVAEQATTLVQEEKLTWNERRARALDKRADELLAKAAELRADVAELTAPVVNEDGTVTLKKLGWFKALWVSFKEWRAECAERRAVVLQGKAELRRKTAAAKDAAKAAEPQLGTATGDERKALRAERDAYRLRLDAKLLRIEQVVNDSVNAKLARVPGYSIWTLWRGFRAANRAGRALLDEMVDSTKSETVTVESV